MSTNKIASLPFTAFSLSTLNDSIASFARGYSLDTVNMCRMEHVYHACGHWGRDRFLDGHPSYCSRLVGQRYLPCGDNDVRGMTNSKEPCAQCRTLYGKTVVCMPWSNLPEPPARTEEIEKVRRLRFSIALLNWQCFRMSNPRRSFKVVQYSNTTWGRKADIEGERSSINLQETLRRRIGKSDTQSTSKTEMNRDSNFDFRTPSLSDTIFVFGL